MPISITGVGLTEGLDLKKIGSARSLCNPTEIRSCSWLSQHSAHSPRYKEQLVQRLLSSQNVISAIKRRKGHVKPHWTMLPKNTYQQPHNKSQHFKSGSLKAPGSPSLSCVITVINTNEVCSLSALQSDLVVIWAKPKFRNDWILTIRMHDPSSHSEQLGFTSSGKPGHLFYTS